MRISDWSSDVCSSDLCDPFAGEVDHRRRATESHAAEARLQPFTRLHRADQFADYLGQPRMFGALAGRRLSAAIDCDGNVRATHAQHVIEQSLFGLAVYESVGDRKSTRLNSSHQCA